MEKSDDGKGTFRRVDTLIKVVLIENIEKLEVGLDWNVAEADVNTFSLLTENCSVVVRDQETFIKNHFR